MSNESWAYPNEREDLYTWVFEKSEELAEEFKCPELLLPKYDPNWSEEDILDIMRTNLDEVEHIAEELAIKDPEAYKRFMDRMDLFEKQERLRNQYSESNPN